MGCQFRVEIDKFNSIPTDTLNPTKDNELSFFMQQYLLMFSLWKNTHLSSFKGIYLMKERDEPTKNNLYCRYGML